MSQPRLHVRRGRTDEWVVQSFVTCTVVCLVPVVNTNR